MVDGLQKEYSNKLLVMQGRLTPQIGNSIQRFPKKNWEIEFDLIKNLKLSGIEWTIDLDSFDNHPLIDNNYVNNKHISIDKFKYVTCDFFMHIDIFKNTKVRINTAEKLLKKLILSKNLGAFSTIVVPLVDSGKPIFSDDWDHVIKMFYSLTPILKEKNSKIVFELSLNPENQLKFINNFESDNFGINYDIGNSASLGWNPSIEISTLGSVIKHIHIKDRRLNGLTVPLGEGNANFEQISTALRQIHYKGNYTLQCARVPEQSEIMTIQKYIDYVIKIGLI